MDRHIGSRKHFGVRGALVALSSALLLVLTVLPAFAVHDLKFQLDGNTDPASYPGGNTSSEPYDWQSFLEAGGVNGSISAKTAALPAGFTAVGFAADPDADLSTDEAGDYQLPDKTVFATGSKDTLDINPGWQCKKANNVGDKVDIVNAYSAVYIDPVSSHQILYFGVEKSSPNGDSNIAVWFLKDGDAKCSSAGGGNQAFSGHHKVGDLLVVSAFTNGGGVANVAAYEWIGGDGAAGHLSDAPVASGGVCGPPDQPETNNNATACAVTNSGSITPPWKHPDKDGGALNALEFFEGAVDMTAAGILDQCFARFLANTRSSQSTTATIFDFATGDLDICAPSTDLSASITTPASGSTVHYGDSVTLSFSEENDGNTDLTLTFPSRTTLTTFVTTDNTACNTTLAYSSGDTESDGKLSDGETWVYTCTFNVPNTGSSLTVNATGHGYDPVGHDITTLASCTDTASRLCDADEAASVTLTLINPSTALTKTVEAVVTYTYTETNDGNDPLSAVSVSDPSCVANGGTVDPTLATGTTDNVGDDNGDGLLDPGEAWVFTCTITLDGSPSVDITNVATGSGTNSLGEVVTFCPTIGVTPANTICDNQEVDSTRVLIDNITARPAPTAAPSP